MKRCPECDFIYLDTDEFCDLDGTPLVATDVLSDSTNEADPEQEPAAPPPAIAPANSRQSWKRLSIVAVAGATLGIILFLIYFGLTRQRPAASESEVVYLSTPQQQVIPTPIPSPTVSPTIEPTPAAVAKATTAPEKTTARGSLSSSPVSTSGDERTRRGPVRIQLTDGSLIEADEAWRTKEGVWYRRKGLVTRLEPKRVRAIVRVPATPSPSPKE